MNIKQVSFLFNEEVRKEKISLIAKWKGVRILIFYHGFESHLGSEEMMRKV